MTPDAPATYQAVDAMGETVTVTVSAAMPTPAQPDPLPVAYVIEFQPTKGNCDVRKLSD